MSWVVPSRWSIRTVFEPVVTTAFVATVLVNVSRWVSAVCPTVKLSGPLTALLPAVALTRVLELVTFTGFQAVAFARSPALVVSEANAAFRSCNDFTLVCSVLSLALRLVWVWASTCISWEMIVLVSSPLTRPLTLAVDAIGHLLSSVELKIRARGESGTQPSPGSTTACSVGSAQQLQNALRRLVGLREHRGAGLRQEVGPSEVDHLGSHVGVADAAHRSGQ